MVISIICSASLSANPPPAIPSEYWGRATIDGKPAPDGTEVSYFNGKEWAAASTFDGWYSIILAGGDSPLTYQDDPGCSQHWANNEGCIPCTKDVDCIEGHQEGNKTEVYIGNTPGGGNISISVVWKKNASSAETQFSTISLKKGWNLRSLPLEGEDKSVKKIVKALSGQIVILNYNESGKWNVYDSKAPFEWFSNLKTLEYGKAYWIKSDVEQSLGVAGLPAGKKAITLMPGWNFVGFNESDISIPDAIGGLTKPIAIFEYNESGKWSIYDTEAPFPWFNTLKRMRHTMGYWIRSSVEQVWKI